MTAAPFFRGTQKRDPSVGVRRILSFTPSLGAALVYSARPSDVWANRPKATFLPTSTVYAAYIHSKRPLRLSESLQVSMGDVVRSLDYGKPNGITGDEVKRIFNYLHNRLTGRASGGEFGYKVFDEDGDLMDENDLDLSFFDPITLISEVREDFEWNGKKHIDRVFADAFIFADAPAVQRVALRLGYDILIYPDVFAGGEYATPQLLGVEVFKLDGVSKKWDEIENEFVPSHETARCLDPEKLEYLWGVSSEKIVEDFRPA